jgi:methylated-DNA-[protein]-cysteine S-methyltransferase
MTTHGKTVDRDIETWLAGERPAKAPPFAQLMDQVYAAGPTPAEWQRARQGVAALATAVYYDRLASTPVGPLWIAVTDKGLAAVAFGGDEAAFRQEVARRTRLRTVRSADQTATARRQLGEYLNGRRTSFTLDVDLRHVTPFQRSVLQAASAVPRGQVVTYGQIGERIGRPRAARAIGQALGSNPIPIVVPCHRVLASDGSLGGYSGRGGIRTKRRLLLLEGALVG